MNDKLRIKKLEEMLIKVLWMARRYADGRCTYAPSDVNQVIDEALNMGLKIDKDPTLDDPMYARDGQLGQWINGRFEKE
jgi:hypothetical protein